MKFGDRYEILEIVTSGRVTTFLGRDRSTQEPAVVYTFEYAGMSFAELSTASIIARFASLAPSPPGTIVNAGFDEASCSAFITTKMPDAEALQGWVQAYQSLGKPGASSSVAKLPSDLAPDQTAELNVADLSPLIAPASSEKKQPGVGDSSTWPASGTSPLLASDGEFTKLLKKANAFEPLHRSESPASAKPGVGPGLVFGQELDGRRLGGKESDPTTGGSSPESFTRVFRGISHQEGVGTGQGPDSSSEPSQPEPGSFTREFLAASHSGATPSEAPHQVSLPVAPSLLRSTLSESQWRKPGTSPDPSEENESAKAASGEFTEFFRDPFDTPRGHDIPIVQSARDLPKEQQTGDFTRMFGREEGAPSPAIGATEQPAPGLKTQLFGEDSSVRPSQPESSILGTNAHLRSSFPKPTESMPQAAPQPPAHPPVDPFGHFSPIPAPPLRPEDHTLGFRPASSSTEVFRQGMQAPPIEDVPAGPSEFTVFVSRNQVKAIPSADVASPPPNPMGGMQAPAFAPPRMPQPIPFTPPKPPPLPVMPAPPPLPQTATLAKSGSYWPLITVLTGLFAIAALLIMYFVMKH
jgi:hypothetical protein